MKQLDATLIYPGLYQGSAPRSVGALLGERFSTVVFCAVENQPAREIVGPLIDVLYCPLIDTDLIPLDARDAQRAHDCASLVRKKIRAGEKVLVTCMQGWNRSGLVTALAYRGLTGRSGRTAVLHVQSCRHRALGNREFVSYLAKLP